MKTPTQFRKRNTVIYWIFTAWLSLGMLSTATVQLLKNKDEVENFTHLGYPLYLMTLIGIWKILGVIAVLIPKRPLLKEWAYAGFFFVISGAIISHIASDHNFSKIFASLLLLVLTIISWYFRPAERKMI
ncbi:DoxX family protein [Chryseobacterium soli]|uniref:DoxX family protein n=1 Tax=Chryseobacterium soli TaxID=445961 RepID=UPI0029554A3C|nr:DoxX family protein [Chryseobacterium soli]MDV7696042.1 DoxX family protein [Chryseobacterium soli]